MFPYINVDKVCAYVIVIVDSTVRVCAITSKALIHKYSSVTICVKISNYCQDVPKDVVDRRGGGGILHLYAG
jgi:hypothetical protein